MIPDVDALDDARSLDFGLDGQSLRGVDLGEQSLAGARWLESALISCTADRLDLPRLVATETLVSECAFGVLSAKAATARDVLIDRSRIGAALLDGSDLTDVRIEDSRLDVLSLRGATVRRLEIVDSRIGLLDVGDARVEHLRVTGGSVEEFVGSRAGMDRVDLTATALGRIADPSAVRGVTLTSTQAMEQAETFATHLGATIAVD